MARDLAGELESYGGDPANLVHSGTFVCDIDRCSSVNESVIQELFRGLRILILPARKAKHRDPFIARFKTYTSLVVI